MRRRRIRALGRWLVHRGPDAWGEWTADGVALGHNRLAILDLEGGQQPMISADGRVVLIFNGEIYNFDALRRELESAGHVFRTDHSDTEVILEGYRAWGHGVLARLDGMFAIAVWDVREQELLLARDPMGIKPLYYAAPEGGGICFASEPKALLGAGLVQPRLRGGGLTEYFLMRAPMGPGTLIEGLLKLEPGFALTYRFSDGSIHTRRFATFGPAGDPQEVRRSSAPALHEILDASVSDHLVSDVPLGAFLSGGVDSSLITALAASGRNVDSFTVATDSELDERPFAERVARHMGSRHHVLEVEADDFLESGDDWAYVNDDPSADPSALALMLLTRYSRDNGMKVMLAGEGADELFGGYNAYLRYALVQRLGGLPLGRRIGRSLLRGRNGRLSDYLSQRGRPYYLGTGHLTDHELRRSLIHADLHGTDDDMIRRLQAASHAHAPSLRQAMRVDQRFRLPDDILMRTDRATMYYALEARVPFLYRDVVCAAEALPDRQCVRLFGKRTKILLKSVARALVPPDVVDRPKRGFDLPIGAWLRERFLEELRDYQRDGRIEGIDYTCVSQLLSDLEASRASRSDGVIWAWMTLERWYREWVLGGARPRCPEVLRSLPGVRALAGESARPAV